MNRVVSAFIRANITQELLTIDRRNEYILFYKNAVNLVRYAYRPNVTEKVLRCGNKLWWDQVLVPTACMRYGVDVLLSSQVHRSAPRATRDLMVLHEAGGTCPVFGAMGA